MWLQESSLVSYLCTLTPPQKRIQRLAEITAEAKERQAGTQQKLDQSNQELETLKQQEGQEEDKLGR